MLLNCFYLPSVVLEKLENLPKNACKCIDKYCLKSAWTLEDMTTDMYKVKIYLSVKGKNGEAK